MKACEGELRCGASGTFALQKGNVRGIHGSRVRCWLPQGLRQFGKLHQGSLKRVVEETFRIELYYVLACW